MKSFSRLFGVLLSFGCLAVYLPCVSFAQSAFRPFGPSNGNANSQQTFSGVANPTVFQQNNTYYNHYNNYNPYFRPQTGFVNRPCGQPVGMFPAQGRPVVQHNSPTWGVPASPAGAGTAAAPTRFVGGPPQLR
jgi:hypothetical protein